MLTTRIDCQLHYQVQAPAHLLFNVQAAHSGPQFVQREQTQVWGADGVPVQPLREFLDAEGNRFLRFDAPPGPLSVRYQASVVQLRQSAPEQRAGLLGGSLDEVPVAWLPDHVLRYLMPSRFCES